MDEKNSASNQGGYKVGPGCPPKEYQFKPGESGYPAGKPKGRRDTKTILREFFDMTMNGTNPINGRMEEMTVEQKINLAMIGQALAGNTKAYAAIIERLYGKVPQPLEHSGPEGVPLAPPNITIVGVEGDKPPEGI